MVKVKLSDIYIPPQIIFIIINSLWVRPSRPYKTRLKHVCRKEHSQKTSKANKVLSLDLKY